MAIMNKDRIQERMAQLVAQYGEWVYDLPLPHGIWTRGNQGIPHTRLKRLLQIVKDLSRKPLSSCRILDLGCLDGLFAIEFGLHGARVTGLDIREGHIKKASICRRGSWA